ncbi:MauE/DoxX family redox-associated membrane protein [Pedobacter cryoconitis]|uniref:MauE/DoxX family redox-associated membrane protein n=1 Tax=Pedobacter cryoconitis TaxID=188932 RepID=UPI0016152344|nr:MauE/DoxX family redox-associated membrane protein [Pedobacter cryoconitis]MBB5646300.1 hypothetical protein [Pedobacter cryoconitis]
MNLHPFIIIVTGMLILLWAYAAFSKLFNLAQFQHALMIQVFPRWVGKILVYVLPLSELILVGLLLIPQTRLIGMYSSFFMMGAFTLYVGGVVFKIYDQYPCACGGLFARLGWSNHFKVNIVLTLIALAGVILMEI